MFAFLTVGYGVVHVVVSTWAISVSQAIWPDSTPSEQLRVTDDGEVVILSYGRSKVTFRKLDGTPDPLTTSGKQSWRRPVMTIGATVSSNARGYADAKASVSCPWAAARCN